MDRLSKSDANATRRAACLTGGLMAAGAAAWLLPVSPATRAAEGGSAGAAGKAGPVTLEAIAGSTVKRITLTAKAAERLGIATDKVSEQVVPRRQMVGGLVVPPVVAPVVPPVEPQVDPKPE